jgi:centrosomal protein CEP104
MLVQNNISSFNRNFRLNPLSHNLPNNSKVQNTKLHFNLIEASSEDLEHPLNEILHGIRGNGWVSSRFCLYPQFIYIQFSQPVNLKQINILIHEKNIPSEIKLYYYMPQNPDEIVRNFRVLNYQYLGFIKMDSNQRTNYKAREFRKIYVDVQTLYVKLELSKNYINRFNVFNQVGLMNLEFYGIYLPFLGKSPKNNQNYLDESIRPTNITDEDLEFIVGDKLNDLKNQMERSISLEKYDECKIIKNKIEKVRLIAKKIFDLEFQKKIAVNNEDFDQAKELKNLVEKMKINLESIDKLYDKNSNTFLTQTGEEDQIENEYTKNLSNIPNNNLNDETGQIGESINSFSMMENNNNLSLNNLSSTIKQKKKNIYEDNFLSYDEQILPTILKKINNENEKNEENKEIENDPLEDIDEQLLKDYELIVKIIGEEGLKKLFSKSGKWKGEGFKNFLEKMETMFSAKSDAKYINDLITLIMKLIMIFFDEKQPSTILNTLEIIEKLLNEIKKHKSKLNIDLNITDSLLTKIKSKIGDNNPKIRKKTIELYCYMLSLDFCDYNNLISELIEDELKYLDIIVKKKSSKVVVGKLEILKNVFDDFKNALSNKRTDMSTFPSNLVMNYLIMNVTHSKSEVRKLCRLDILKFINIFGVHKIKKKLEKVDGRELNKLVNEIPALQDVFPNLVGNGQGSNSLDNSYGSRKFNNSKSRSKNKNNKLNTSNKSIKNKTLIKCQYCSKEVKNKEELNSHFNSECLFFINCENCNENIEVKKLTNHRLNECKKKNEYKLCKRCKEAISSNMYDKHVKDNNCLPAKNPNSSNRCPLCHKDIGPGDKGFIQHLIKEECPQHNRKK